MTNDITADTLRTWLEEGRPVAVVDVRTDADRAQWSIPGSVHVDAYADLREGRPGGLAGLALPSDRPVVTVCGAGGVSLTAAAFLSAQGLDARSLTGGMKAWSTAWNTAKVPMPEGSGEIVQVRRTGKGCLSYVAASNGEAVVVDASVRPDVYLDLARSRGWRIRYVLETHIHADHLSRARALAELAGATLLVPEQHRARFPFTPVRDGDRITVGQATITAHGTPGHTDESTSYRWNDAAVFTGDTLFVRGVGRPDLHAGATGAAPRARALFASLNRLRALGQDVVVLPAHASEPIAFDGVPVAARLADLAWLADWLASESAFVERVTSRLPETPPNFTRIVELNEAGHMPPEAADLEAGANRCAIG